MCLVWMFWQFHMEKLYIHSDFCFWYVHVFGKKKHISYRMVWWNVAGFSVLRQTAQRTRCLYMLMGLAARNADVSISCTHLDQAGSRRNCHNQTCEKPLCSSTKIPFHASQIGSLFCSSSGSSVSVSYHFLFFASEKKHSMDTKVRLLRNHKYWPRMLFLTVLNTSLICLLHNTSFFLRYNYNKIHCRSNWEGCSLWLMFCWHNETRVNYLPEQRSQ